MTTKSLKRQLTERADPVIAAKTEKGQIAMERKCEKNETQQLHVIGINTI